jgi:hypothetical protein
VGVAAHITAASPGGPRYDPALTPRQRSAAGNGIWLCEVCAKLIDADQAGYSVAMLQQWKAGAEREARGRLGEPKARAMNPSARERQIKRG